MVHHGATLLLEALVLAFSNLEFLLIELVLFLSSGLAPLHTVDNPVFKELLHGLDPKFQCPGRNYYSRVAIPEYYNSEKKKLAGQLNSAQWYESLSIVLI